MKTFQIEKLNDCKNYKYIVFSTSYINPLDDKELIEKDLRNVYSGRVIFDLLLKNGFCSNRFIDVIFDGERFDLNTTRIIENIDSCIKVFSANYYIKHGELLDNSVLPNAYKFLFKKGRII